MSPCRALASRKAPKAASASPSLSSTWRLAQPRRAEEQHVVERLAPRVRRLDENLEVLAQGLLAHELVQARGTDARLAAIVAAQFGRHDARLVERYVGHADNSLSPSLTRDSSVAPVPSRRLAWATAPKASLRP